MLHVGLAVTFVLLVSTVDAVWLARDGFSGVGTFDALAAFKLAARGLAVVYALWLLPQLGVGDWMWRDLGVRLMAVFLVFAAATSVYSAQPALSASRAISFLGILFFAVVLVRFAVETGRFEDFWDGLYATLGTFVTLVFLASLVLDAAGLKGAEGRLASLYGPNGAASLAGLVVIWSYVRLMGSSRSILSLLFLAAAGAFVVLALSRGAMLTVVTTCAGYALWRRKGFMSLAVLLGMAGIVLALSSALEGGLGGLGSFFTRGHDLSRIQAMNGRVPVYLYLLLEQFPQYPILGVGFQMMSESGISVDIPAHIAVRRGSWLPGHAHNAILQILVGTGLIGLALFTAAWAFILRGLVQRTRLAAPRAYDAMLPLLLFILANAMVETTLTGTIDPNYILAVLIAAAGAATHPMGA